MRPTSVLVTVTGHDRPGVTAVIFAALAAHDVDVRDVDQSVTGQRASLSVLVDLRGDTAALRHSVSSTADAFGVESRVEVAGDAVPAARKHTPRHREGRTHSVVVGRKLRAGALGDVARHVSDVGGNIEAMWQSSRWPIASVEMYIDGNTRRVRKSLIAAADDTGLDIAVEPAGSRLTKRRLLVLDADATLNGDVDEAAYGSRVADFIRTVQGAGCLVAAVTTARQPAADRLAAALELDAAATVADGAGKSAVLERLAASFEVPLSQTVAVGDLSHSDRLLYSAGMAVGVDTRSARRAAAAGTGDLTFLDSVLLVLGLAPQK
jgi:phosphoserine phosphatase